jgi:hypothetical protein
MARKEWGTQPYLRGIPDSVLFLYDTVPMGSDVSKFLHPLDRELSLAAVKRVEVIRGPGSVLWGPDAFGGIVNVVPMTGKDLEGVETGVSYQGPGGGRGCYLIAGHDEGPWDAFLSLSGWKGTEDDTACNFVRFWSDGTKPVPPESRYGDTEPGESRYFEASGRVQFRDWLAFSFLLSDYCRPYALSHPDKDITWRETRSAPFGFLKMEAKKELDPHSSLRFMGYLSSFRPEYEIINKTLDQKEDVAYGEIVYDRSLFSGKGIITAGLSSGKDTTTRPSGMPSSRYWRRITTFLPRHRGGLPDEALVAVRPVHPQGGETGFSSRPPGGPSRPVHGPSELQHRRRVVHLSPLGLEAPLRHGLPDALRPPASRG